MSEVNATEAPETSSDSKVRFLSKTIDLEAKEVDFLLGDGRSQSLGLDELTPEMVIRLALTGVSYKVGNSTSSAEGDFQVAFEAIKESIENLRANRWRTVREGSEGTVRVTELAQAIARVNKVPVEEIVTLLANADDAKKKALRALPQVKLAISEIRNERARAEFEAAIASGTHKSDPIPLT